MEADLRTVVTMIFSLSYGGTSFYCEEYYACSLSTRTSRYCTVHTSVSPSDSRSQELHTPRAATMDLSLPTQHLTPIPDGLSSCMLRCSRIPVPLE